MNERGDNIIEDSCLFAYEYYIILYQHIYLKDTERE